jgi:hypothetical protein
MSYVLLLMPWSFPFTYSATSITESSAYMHGAHTTLNITKTNSQVGCTVLFNAKRQLPRSYVKTPQCKQNSK